MEINRLLSDELAYELQIRGLPVGATVEERRFQLRRAFREEKENNIEAPNTTNLPAIEEFNTCKMKMIYVEEEIRTFDSDNRKNEYERLNTRLTHVIFRLCRITPENDEQKHILAELISKGRKLVAELNLAYEGFPNPDLGASRPNENLNESRRTHMSLLDTSNPLLPEVVHSRSSPAPSNEANADVDDLLVSDFQLPSEDGRRAVQLRSPLGTKPPSHQDFAENPAGSPHVLRTYPVPTSSHSAVANIGFTDNSIDSRQWSRMASADLTDLHRRLEAFPLDEYEDSSHYNMRYVDIGRWNLKYDGLSSVNNFLDRVEELRQSRGVSKPRLLRSAAELFSRDALLWYRTNTFSSWDDLVNQLRDAFQPLDYENGIWEEIRRRTQGAHERVLIFISSMEQLFSRLSQKPPEEERVKLIKRNLLPYIQTSLSLRTIYTIRELIQVSRNVEETELRVQKFCPPSTNYRQLLEPDLAYHRPSAMSSSSIASVSSEMVVPVSTANVVNSQMDATSDPASKVVVCWNCKASGHRFRQCGLPRRLFCFRCGLENVTSSTCPKCSKNLRQGRQ